MMFYSKLLDFSVGFPVKINETSIYDVSVETHDKWLELRENGFAGMAYDDEGEAFWNYENGMTADFESEFGF